MNQREFAFALLLGVFASSTFAQPTLSVTPVGIQSGNWVWDVSVTPDLALPSDGTTPLAVELGFRLTGAPLLSVTNVNPSEWDYSAPGRSIFGWETRYPEDNNNPEGIEANCTGCTVINPIPGPHPSAIVTGTTNEIFVAMGSVIFTTPGPKALLRIVGKGPGNGGSAFSGIQWLGAYAGGNGRIYQMIYDTGQGFDVLNGFDAYVGLASQSLVRGDMNGDGTVGDDADKLLFVYGLMNSEYKYGLKCDCGVTRQEGGDFNGNGRLDFDDIAGFAGARHLSAAAMTAEIASFLSPVPEPASAILMICAGAAFAWRRNRRAA